MPKLSVQFELETPNAVQQGQKAGTEFGKGFSKSVLDANRDLIAKLSQGVIRPPNQAGGPSGILKLLNLVQTSNIDPVIKGLRDVTGSDLAKVASLGGLGSIKGLRDVSGKDLGKVISMGVFGANVIKGLRETGGADLAKITSLPDINSFGGGRMKNLLLGLGSAPFSSWIGARMLSSAAFGSGGGGGGHGLLGAGGAGGFAEFFIGIEALKKAFEYGAGKIKEVVEKGFNLYVRSAQLRTSAGSLFALTEAGKQVGLSDSDIEKFLLRNNWGKARTSLQNFGVFSQIGGLSKDFKDAYQWASEIQQKWQDTSRTTYEMQINFDRIKTDWLTMWNDSGFLGAIDKMEQWVDETLHLAAIFGIGGSSPMMEWLVTGTVAAGNLPNGKGGAGGIAPLFNLPRSLPQMSSFEKMGFNIGGGKVPDKLDKANSLLQAILTGINNVVHNAINANAHHVPGGSGGLVNVP